LIFLYRPNGHGDMRNLSNNEERSGDSERTYPYHFQTINGSEEPKRISGCHRSQTTYSLVIVRRRGVTRGVAHMLKAYPWMDQSQSIGSDVVNTGWKRLIDHLLVEIDAIMVNTSAVLTVFQVKEKLGSLRFYCDLRNASDIQTEKVAELIDGAVKVSTRTCIACGAPGVMQRRGGWIACLCDTHVDIEPI
jgi:hypothetical protein